MTERTPALKGLYGCLMGALLLLVLPLGIFLVIVGWVVGSGELTQIGATAALVGGVLGFGLAILSVLLKMSNW